MNVSTKRIAVTALMVTGMTLFFSLTVMAHDLWLEARNYTPKVGENITLELANAHHFPAYEFLDKKDLEEIYAIDGKGNRIGIKAESEFVYKTEKSSQDAGTYLVVAQKKGGFSTKTTDGYKSGQTKKGLKNVIKCTYYAKYAKAVVNVGAAGGNSFSKVLGHKLEMVPMADPGTLAEGDYLPVKVLLEGKPVPSVQLLATYMGFSTDKNTFAYATKTDKNGMARIKMLRYGVWLVTTSLIKDYPDTAECDQYKFCSSLTFEIK